MTKIFTIAVCLTLTALLHTQTTIRVTPNGSGNGTSWANACNLETAVSNAVSGTEIWVQKGTHYPTKMLFVPASVKVYGGFAGTETTLSQRNFIANPTIVDGRQKIGSIFRLENSAEINGFTIQNGNANGNPQNNGGGVWADENSVIANCVIKNNSALIDGGGIYAKGVSELINSVVKDNTAHGNGNNTFGNCLTISGELTDEISPSARLCLDTLNLDYTGLPEEIVLLSGTYQIECWGARGGQANAKGAYTKGILNVEQQMTVFAYVGGMGFLEQTGTGFVMGGWNGGGSGYNAHAAASVGAARASGGGATDIRLVYGEWKTEPVDPSIASPVRPITDTYSLRSRIMVAGGGGTYSSAYAGGLVGGNADRSATGGTQIAGGNPGKAGSGRVGSSGSFGIGGSLGAELARFYGRGGGAGWYGGGSGGAPSGVGCSSGGGGSSFISGYEGCDAVNEDGTHRGHSIHYSGLVFTETVMFAGNQPMPNPRGAGDITGNSGNGFIRIIKKD